MARYGDEFKRSIMMKMMPPQNQSISQVARETGLSEATASLRNRAALLDLRRLFHGCHIMACRI